MVYELIAGKLENLKGNRKKISSDNSNKINLLKNRISQIKIDEDKLINMLMQDNVEADLLSLLNERAKRLSAERKELSKKINMLEEEESDVINVINLSKKWKTAKYEERKAVTNVLIYKIIIDEDGTVEVIWNI